MGEGPVPPHREGGHIGEQGSHEGNIKHKKLRGQDLNVAGI